jgi:hypothetical protein
MIRMTFGCRAAACAANGSSINIKAVTTAEYRFMAKPFGREVVKLDMPRCRYFDDDDALPSQS